MTRRDSSGALGVQIIFVPQFFCGDDLSVTSSRSLKRHVSEFELTEGDSSAKRRRLSPTFSKGQRL